MTKVITWITFVLVCAGLLWAGLVYGAEFKTDTENWIEDNIKQEQVQESENENTETETVLTVNAMGQVVAIN